MRNHAMAASINPFADTTDQAVYTFHSEEGPLVPVERTLSPTWTNTRAGSIPSPLERTTRNHDSDDRIPNIDNSRTLDMGEEGFNL